MSRQRLLIYAAVVAVVLIGAYVYIFHIAQLHISPEEKAARARLAQHIVYYECKRTADFSAENYNICAINADGSNKREIMGGESAETTFGSLSINNNGTIVFHCEYFQQGVGGVQHNICAQRPSDDEPVRMGFPRNDRRSDLIGLNDAGLVVTTCGDLLCISEIGAGGYAEIPNSDGNGQAIGPAVNNNEQIAFTCWELSEPRSREICAIEPDGSGFRVLSDSGDGRAFNPQILESGEIYYGCGDETDLYNICTINYDGTGFGQLTEVGQREDALNPVAHPELGVIVYECWLDVRHAHLCIMNIDGSNARQLTPEPEHDGSFQYINPAISDDGLVAFGCDRQLCVINSDGTDMRKLTGDAFGDYGARRPVIYYTGE